MQKILVTGGAGFLGSHLCERLLREGRDVLCVDNFFTGGKQNIVHLLGNPYFELMRHDVTFPLYVEVDRIYNLACPASPVHYRFDPVQTTKTSVHGAINMLGLAKRVKARILQASTSEVYGDPEVGLTGPVNLGNPAEYTMLGLAEGVIRLTGSRSEIAFRALPEDDPKQRKPDIRLAKSRLNWMPKVSLEDGLKETIRYFRRLLEQPSAVAAAG